jgi:glycerophosphoryl diester phosphodiesterase
MSRLADRSGLLKIGHKGADSIFPGNTLESFEKAVEVGVDIIEFDVLRLRDPDAPLVVAHDWHDAATRTPLTLAECLDAFSRPPLDRVEIDLDIKLPGREEEIADALRKRGLVERAMVSTASRRCGSTTRSSAGASRASPTALASS